MTITANDQYRHPPRISKAAFGSVLRERANPEVAGERNTEEYYDAITSFGVDPLFLLAMFNHESSLGKAGVAVTSKSWGNTRAPNFGATPVGTMPGRSGTFPIWTNWLDGCISTAARLATADYYYAFEERTIGEVFNDPHFPSRNPDKPAREPIPRRQNQPIEWAPAGDMNSPTGYLNAMLRFMNDHQDIDNGQEPPVPAKTPLIALAAGHHNSNRGGAVGEYERVGPLVHEIARQLREHGGFNVHMITPDDGMGDFPGGLQDVAREAVRLNADCFLEVHMEGNGAGDAGRGCFAIYPDWTGDLDTDVRDKLGPDMANRVRQLTAIPLRGNGLMSERATGVGSQGFRLGAFGASAAAKATMTRLLFEYGALTSPRDRVIIDDPDFRLYAAQATVGALAAFYGVQVADEPIDPRMTPKPHPDARGFTATGQWIMLGFKDYWQQFDNDATSIEVFGYPLTGELPWETPSGAQGAIQYFERSVFEYHPDLGKVLLRRLGADALEEAA